MTSAYPTMTLFDETAHYGTRETVEAAQQYWDNRAPSYKKHQDIGDNDALHEKIIETIRLRTGLNKTHKILDIGCGPGRHSRLLGEIAQSVEAFDLSPTMIDLAKKSLPPGLNINYSVLNWDQADIAALGWEGEFYLTFASRTPAIKDLLTLNKMNQTIKSGFGVFISSLEIYNSLRSDLLELLAVDLEKTRSTRSIYLIFNLLWLMGFFPELTYFDQKWIAPRPLEGAIANQIRYFEKMRPLSDKDRDLIAQTLTAKSQDGLVNEEVTAKTLLMIWENPPQINVSKVIVDQD